VHDAPDVAQKDLIVARERTEPFDEGNCHCGLNQAIPYWRVKYFVGRAFGNDPRKHYVRTLAARTS
jgi:hypothetical protein